MAAAAADMAVVVAGVAGIDRVSVAIAAKTLRDSVRSGTSGPYQGTTRPR
jgi:hypothetical protein